MAIYFKGPGCADQGAPAPRPCDARRRGPAAPPGRPREVTGRRAQLGTYSVARTKSQASARHT